MQQALGPGRNLPESFNVLIEINPSSFVKYEFDKSLGLLKVDRILSTSMAYPCSYGFIPGSLAGDGDPVDVLLYASQSIHPGALIEARTIGVLLTEDESGQDAKILAVPHNKVDLSLVGITSYKDLPEFFLKKVEHFFSHYKDLESGKWVKVVGWEGAEAARSIIIEAIEKYNAGL